MPTRNAPSLTPIVGIGASAGGLEACARLLDKMPADTGLAFILVQHLDPSQPSLMVELLAKHTQMTISEAIDGAVIAPNHVYVIAPGTYLSVRGGRLQVSAPNARHGARLPFDFLLESLAESEGARAIAIVLSGTGADGNLGLQAIKAKQGLVIAQDPDEADYGGMPRSAIDSNLVDRVLRTSAMADVLIAHVRQLPNATPTKDSLGETLAPRNAEAINNSEGSFEVISKSHPLDRKLEAGRHVRAGLTLPAGNEILAPPASGKSDVLQRQAEIAAFCRQLVIDAHAPATVLINSKYDWLYSLGPIDRYLRVASGHPSHDLFDMASPLLQTRLRAAINDISREQPAACVAGGKTGSVPFNIDIRLVSFHGEELLLICFVDAVAAADKRGSAATSASATAERARIADLEYKLDATPTELQGAIHGLEKSGEGQRAINEDAMSVNEEFQSTNEELLTSKEELQSLNEELTALNSQLQATLARQRTTANDLQNVLYSTDVATLFLDEKLNIRFFTPATKALFNVISGDIGRPLADLDSLASDMTLSADARTVLATSNPIDAEIETENGVLFLRRIMPYLADNETVEGVVITFTNITERIYAARLLQDAKREAELATVAKSRFLAVASHDLRQPLQTLALLQGLLRKKVQGEDGQMLVTRLDETLGAMTGMLNTLLDINQIESGVVQPQMARFAVDDLLAQLRDEFSYNAQAKALDLRVVGCSLEIQSDRTLLEQMLRNLISNAIKYTHRGKILIGCRRRAHTICIQVLDTGIGIVPSELASIFDEYHQVDNAARERSLGLGLGLSIVQRLSVLLGHQIEVRSSFGKGSIFSVEVGRPQNDALAALPSPKFDLPITTHAATILVVEDDPEVRALLQLLLEGEGHRLQSVSDGVAALQLIEKGLFKPDIVMTDYNLPNELDGLQVARKLRELLGVDLPVIVLTGDISKETMCDVSHHNCAQLNKPVKMAELVATIHKLLPAKS